MSPVEMFRRFDCGCVTSKIHAYAHNAHSRYREYSDLTFSVVFRNMAIEKRKIISSGRGITISTAKVQSGKHSSKQRINEKVRDTPVVLRVYARTNERDPERGKKEFDYIFLRTKKYIY